MGVGVIVSNVNREIDYNCGSVRVDVWVLKLGGTVDGKGMH